MILSIKQREALISTGISLTKALLIGSVMISVAVSVVAATIPGAPKPKFIKGGGTGI